MLEGGLKTHEQDTQFPKLLVAPGVHYTFMQRVHTCWGQMEKMNFPLEGIKKEIRGGGALQKLTTNPTCKVGLSLGCDTLLLCTICPY